MAEVHPVVAVVGDEYALPVGKIITLWAYEEWLLKDCAYKAIGIGPKYGRLAVREPRGKEYPNFIRSLLLARNIVLTYDYNALTNLIEDGEEIRNMFAHSIWVKNPSESRLTLQITTGNWQGKPAPKVSKKILPEGRPITEEYFAHCLEVVDTVIRTTIPFREAIYKLLPEQPQ